jgi:tetratricopeptide (TPR) repeat protein
VAVNPAALRQARLERGWSLERVAHGIVSRQALQQFEAGRTRPTGATLGAIAARLGVPLDALLARPHDPRERTMHELEERKDWPELERLATVVLADRNVTARTQAVARFYLGRALIDVAPEEALTHLHQARGQLAKVGEPWLAAQAREWEAAALYLMQSPLALDVGRDALARYRVLTDRDPAIEARMLEHIGTYQLQRQEVADAMESYRAAIDVAGSVLNLARLATLYHGIASAFLRLGQPRDALEYFERAVGFARTHHDVRGEPTASLARLESDYGDLLIRTGRWDRAEEMIQSALDHFRAAGVASGQASTMLSMGDLHRQRGDIIEAMRWTSEAIDMAERLGETVTLAVGYQQLAELHAAQGDLDRFEAGFSRAIELLDRVGLRERRAEALERYRRIRDSNAEPRCGG